MSSILFEVNTKAYTVEVILEFKGTLLSFFLNKQYI